LPFGRISAAPAHRTNRPCWLPRKYALHHPAKCPPPPFLFFFFFLRSRPKQTGYAAASSPPPPRRRPLQSAPPPPVHQPRPPPVVSKRYSPPSGTAIRRELRSFFIVGFVRCVVWRVLGGETRDSAGLSGQGRRLAIRIFGRVSSMMRSISFFPL
jgi:hypothetical protein